MWRGMSKGVCVCLHRAGCVCRALFLIGAQKLRFSFFFLFILFRLPTVGRNGFPLGTPPPCPLGRPRKRIRTAGGRELSGLGLTGPFVVEERESPRGVCVCAPKAQKGTCAQCRLFNRSPQAVTHHMRCPPCFAHGWTRNGGAFGCSVLS